MAQAITSLARSWALQRRVIFALLMREALTRYGRHNIGFLWLFVEPMIFTIGVTLLWYSAGLNHGSSLPISVFALTGYSCVLLWRNMPSRSIGAIQPNLALMYHRNVRIIDIFVARLILEGMGATMSFFILSLIFIYLFEWISPPENISQIILGWLALAWFGFALACMMGAFAEKSELVDKLWHPFTYLMFPLSGAAFMVEALPVASRKFIMWIPMVSCTEFIREGYFGSKFHAFYDMTYVVLVNLGLTFMALLLIRDITGKVTPK
ncbi:ABC transporter permease [Sphingobium sp. AN558]|uniref:ABC transporter permease n=1 Tax=Sphingobium sp. AN558 TaxID=3133442 RepID=UPI0030BE4DF2